MAPFFQNRRRLPLGVGALFMFVLSLNVLFPAVGEGQSSVVRLLVAEGKTSLTISALDLQVQCVEGAALSVEGQSLTLQPSPSGILVNSRQSGCVTLRIASPAVFLKIGQREYRSPLNIHLRSNQLSAVNPLDLEVYLRALVATEMPAGWPEEALKAQAIVARSYALARLTRTKDNYFDLYASTKDQAYGGAQKEDYRVVRAVKKTAGQILERHGRIIETYYHAICGGRTELPYNVWAGGGAFPPSTICEYCQGSPRFNWSHKISANSLAQKLREAGFDSKQVKALERKASGAGGRWTVVSVYGDGQPTVIQGNEFRRLVGYSKLRSLDFSVTIKGETIVFEGTGFGHGVGMCQWGSRAMAREGKDYRQILTHYYPGSTLTTL